MRRFAKKAISATLGLALAAVPLAGCSAKDDSADDATTEEVVESDDSLAMESRTPTGNPDCTTWKTLGDAFAAATEDPTYGYDDNYYTGVIPVNDRLVYVAAKVTPDVLEKVEAVDIETDDYIVQREKAFSALAIEVVDDITDKAAPQEELDSFVGKTGQDLVNAGYKFAYFSVYGEDTEPIAVFEKGYYAYSFSFATTVTDEQAEDGSLILGATVTSADFSFDTSDAATNPLMVGMIESPDTAGVPVPEEAVPAEDETMTGEPVEAPAEGEAPVEEAPVEEAPAEG